MKNTIRCCLNLLLGILILAGCSNPVLERIETPASNGTGAVSVRIGTVENAARTLGPAAPSWNLTYTLVFSGPEAHNAVDISSGNTNALVELAVGTWTITATAYAGRTEVAHGSATVAVIAEANNSANIILVPSGEGTGTFHYSINVPSGATGSLVIVTTDGTPVDGGNIELGSSNINNLSLPSGQYLMSISLTLDGEVAGRTEAVYIYSGMTTDAVYSFTKRDFSMVVPLSESVWTNDEIITSGEVKWYSFVATEGSTYQVQWNTSEYGDGTKTLYYAYVLASRADGGYIFQVSNGWTSPPTVYGVTGTVYLQVEAYGNTGTYAIRYYDSTSMPPQESMTISSVTATPIPACVISWNYVESVTGYHLYRSTSLDGDYAQIAEMEGGYNYSYTDTSVSAGSTYYYKVAAYNANGEGELSSARSGTPLDSSVITTLSDNVWTDGDITTSGDVKWYSFTASAGTSYQVQWNAQYYGDGTKTLPYAYVSAFRADGGYIFQQTSNGWTSPRTVSGVTGTVYLRVQGSGTGTYAIRYYDPTSMPPQASMSISVTVILFPAPSCVVSWNYVEGVTGYHLYRSTNPDSDYVEITDITGYYNNSYTDTDVSAGSTYYYKVAAYNANGEGELSSAKSGTPPDSSAITTLSDNVWIDGEITTSGDVKWYSFTASEGSAYQVQWNDSYQGDRTKTLDIKVSAFEADGSPIFQTVDSGWTSPRTVSGVTGTVYLKVEAYSSGNTGTYAIKYAQE
jgi:fibronectin type 3 domain-containing protein